MSVNAVNPCGRSTRSTLEIDQELSPTLKKIQEEMEKRLRWRNSFLPVSKNILWNVVNDPTKSLFKMGICAGTGYVTYLLTRGTFAGIEVDMDSNFTNIFSSNKDVRLQEGLNMTNGDQAGQFIIDGLATIYVTSKLILSDPYHKFAGEVINDCYKPHLIQRMTSIHSHPKNQTDPEQVKQLEEVDRLYKHLENDLRTYGQKPLFSREIVFIPAPDPA